MVGIYDEAAPSISSAMDIRNQEFLDEVIRIISNAINEAGGSMEGVSDRENGRYCLTLEMPSEPSWDRTDEHGR